MFSKLPQQAKQQQQQHPWQFSRDCHNTSEEDESRSSGGPALKPASTADGATIEVVRRPRGRPPGSKNKPKPPLVIARGPEPASTMSPYILEIPGGSDVVDSIARFSRRKNTGLVVLSGSGTVANVTLRQPSTAAAPGSTVTFHGRLDILSISAAFFPGGSSPSPAVPSGFSISLGGPQGQVVGGIVAGRLIAAGTVFVIAASFNNPTYQRVQSEDEDARDGSAGGSGGGEVQSPQASGGGGGAAAVAAEGGEPCGAVGMYNCHLPSDVMWAPAARPPPF